MQKRNLVFSGLTGLVLMGAVTAGPDPGQDPKPPWKNVKIFSKDMEDEKMDAMMHMFNSQLGVTCIYCHIIDTIKGKSFANFYSDAMPVKAKARQMLKMTFRLNKKYFNTTLNSEMTQKPVIWCGICHHGQAIPVAKLPRRLGP